MTSINPEGRKRDLKGTSCGMEGFVKNRRYIREAFLAAGDDVSFFLLGGNRIRGKEIRRAINFHLLRGRFSF